MTEHLLNFLMSFVLWGVMSYVYGEAREALHWTLGEVKLLRAVQEHERDAP
jgi:hypothetical protein